MNIGTKSILFGAHCFFIHPWFVAAGWAKLYGFPWDPRLWMAFFLHDIGYWGKPNMDGPEGESHPTVGAKIMGKLFDTSCPGCADEVVCARLSNCLATNYWHNFCLYHSRYYAKRHGEPVSKLCFADKLAFTLTPSWLYLPMVTATGEIKEYLKNAQVADSAHWTPTGYDKRKWHKQLCEYMRSWVTAHINGNEDTWTDVNRHAVDESGVTK